MGGKGTNILNHFFCTYRSPITRSVQELTRRRILEIMKTQNILSPVFKVKGLPQQDHFKFKGYKIKITTKNEVKNQDKDSN